MTATLCLPCSEEGLNTRSISKFIPPRVVEVQAARHAFDRVVKALDDNPNGVQNDVEHVRLALSDWPCLSEPMHKRAPREVAPDSGAMSAARTMTGAIATLGLTCNHRGMSHPEEIHEEDARRPETSQDVITALVENHRAFLAFLEPRVSSRAIAEDILQEAFAKSLDKVATIRDDESAVAWFYRVLRNAVIDHYRRSAAKSRSLEKLAKEMEQHEAPSDEVRNAVCKCVADLATTLKPEYREALEAVELKGVAVKDYATQVGLSSNNAGVRVFRAREALRKQVVRSCGTCASHGCLDCACGQNAHGHA